MNIFAFIPYDDRDYVVLTLASFLTMPYLSDSGRIPHLLLNSLGARCFLLPLNTSSSAQPGADRI